MILFKKILRKINSKLKREKYLQEELDFISLNKKFWEKKVYTDKDNPKILVEVSGNILRPIITAMFLAKKLEETEKKQIVVSLFAPVKSVRSKSEVYKSFNVNEFFCNNSTSLKNKCRAFYDAVKVFLSVNNGKDILNLTYLDCNVGEDLYDGILRGNSKICTVEYLSILDIYRVYKLFLKMRIYNNFFMREKIDSVIYTDLDYAPECALTKICIKHKVTMYYAGAGKYIKFNTKKILGYKLKNVGSPIKKEWLKFLNDNTNIEKANEYIEKRFRGEAIWQYDKEAFVDKKIYTKKELFSLFDIKINDRKNVFIAAHIFSDIAHYGFGMIYQDYYVWLCETMRILEQNKNINIFLKVHPSYQRYGEGGVIEKILKKLDIKHIHLLPLDFSTASIKELADYIVTCQGTMGLEMSCFGIPAFTASKGYYYGFDIDINSSTKEEYEERLTNIEKYSRLSIEKQEKAKMLLYFIFRKKENDFPTVLNNNSKEVFDYKYWEYPFLQQYKEIIEKLRMGISMKDDYYDKILEKIVEMD